MEPQAPALFSPLAPVPDPEAFQNLARLRPQFDARMSQNFEAWGHHFVYQQVDYTQFFPWCPHPNGLGQISPPLYSRVVSQGFYPPLTANETATQFLAMLPHYVPPEEAGYEYLHQRIKQLSEETFGSDAQQSVPEAIRRLSVVFGLNRRISLEPEEDVTFKNYVESCPLSQRPFQASVIGFLWKPQWQMAFYKPTIEQQQQGYSPYPLEDAFRFVKWLNPKAAAQLKHCYYHSLHRFASFGSQIPMQDIRQALLTAPVTQFIASSILRQVPTCPFYGVVMDSDFVALRVDSAGHLTWYDRHIFAYRQKHGYLPEVATTGYAAPDDTSPGLRLAIRADMCVRRALTTVFPNDYSRNSAAYIPEPSFLFLIKSHPQFIQFAFNKTERGASLESRRFLHHAGVKGLLDTSRLLFALEGSLKTTVTRFGDHSKIEGLATIESEDFLTAMHSVAQSHLNVRSWAEHVLVTSPILPKVKNAYNQFKSQACTLFTCYDPTTLARSMRAFLNGDWRAGYFSFFKQRYPTYVSYLNAALQQPNNAPLILAHFATQFGNDPKAKAFLEAQHQQAANALNFLRSPGGRFIEWGNSVHLAAERSGYAILEALKDLTFDPSTIKP